MDDRGVDRLFSLPLSDFVPARNELVKELKAQGDKETAARIQKLPKPSVSAWAINQVVRRDRSLIDELLETLDRQRQLQVDGLGSGVDREAMKEAKQAENEVVGRIERELVPILEEGEHSSARSMIERCVRAIRAAAVHAVGRPLLENGHLTVDFDSPGFEALGASMEAVPNLRLVTSAVEEKKRAKEERLEQMRNDRIEAQAKIEADLQRVKQTMIDGDRAPKKKKPDPQRVKQTMFDEPVELPDLQRARQTISEANPLDKDPERAKQTMIDLEHRKQKAQLGDATKRLAALRLECAKLEEELGQKKSQIANLEKLLGMFDEEEE